MASEDEATLKLLEDMIRRVVREELERHRPSAPLFDGRQWQLDVPTSPVGDYVYTAGRHD